METAKVDVRKLQMLNDRINQTIEALNQVRLSVHGISNGTTGTNGTSVNHLLGAFPGALAQGLPYGANGGVPVHPGVYGQFAPQPWGAPPFTPQIGFGNTSPEVIDYYTRRAMGNDPFIGNRIAQTFPFGQWGYSPLASGYPPFASATF